MKSVRRVTAVWVAVLLLATSMALDPASAGEPAPAASDTELQEQLEQQDAEASLEQASQLPEDDGLDEIVNDAVLTDPVELVDPEPLISDPAVEVENGELSLSTPANLGSTITMTKTVRGAKASELDTSGKRAKFRDNVVLESTASSIRILEVINSRKDVHRFRYNLEVDGKAASLEMAEDGSVLIFTVDDTISEDSGVTYYGSIDPAWVVDANGERVDVEFKISRNGKSLRLNVPKQKKSAYPLVADPAVKVGHLTVDCGWTSCTAYHTVKKTVEAWRLANNRGEQAMIGFVVGAFCGALAFLIAVNPIIGIVLGASCATVITHQGGWWLHHSTEAVRRSPDGCVTAKFSWRGMQVGNVAKNHKHCHSR